MALRACPSCDRHVRIPEAVCPFCGATQPEPPAAALPARSAASFGSRAAILFGGAAVIAACNGSTTGESSGVALYGAPYDPPDASADADGGSIVAMYGAPAPDASADAPSDGPADATADTGDGGGPVPAYGAPGPDQ